MTRGFVTWMKCSEIQVGPALSSAPCGLRAGSGRRNHAVLLQAPDDQVEQPKPEFGVLEIQLLEAVVIDPRGLHVGPAAHRRDAPAVRREQADLAEQRAGTGDLAELDDLDF